MSLFCTLPRDIFSFLVNVAISEEDYKSLRLTSKASRARMNDAMEDLVLHNLPPNGDNSVWRHALQQFESNFRVLNFEFLSSLFELLPMEDPSGLSLTHRFEQWALGFPRDDSWLVPIRPVWPLVTNPTEDQLLSMALNASISERLDNNRILLQNLRIYGALSFAYNHDMMEITHETISWECISNMDTVFKDMDLRTTQFICMSPVDVVSINNNVFNQLFRDKAEVFPIAVPSGSSHWSLIEIAIGTTVKLKGCIGVVHDVRLRSKQSPPLVTRIQLKLNNGAMVWVSRVNGRRVNVIDTNTSGFAQPVVQATFPLVLAYAITGHNLSSITDVGNVVLVLKEPFRYRDLLYVWLSRYAKRSQVTIIESS
jgi:hypothetical protein